jgi:hypothetical protein
LQHEGSWVLSIVDCVILISSHHGMVESIFVSTDTSLKRVAYDPIFDYSLIPVRRDDKSVSAALLVTAERPNGHDFNYGEKRKTSRGRP